MFNTKIKNLVTHIKTQIPLFGSNGFLNNPYKDSEDGFGGVTDKLDLYFFVQLLPSLIADEYRIEKLKDELGDDTLRIGTEMIFVAGAKCVDKYQAVNAFTNALSSFTEFEVVINSASTNAENIYKNLYDQNYPIENQDLFLIQFTAYEILPITNRCTLEFCDDCC